MKAAWPDGPDHGFPSYIHSGFFDQADDCPTAAIRFTALSVFHTTFII